MIYQGSAPCSVGGFLQSMDVEQFHFYVLYMGEKGLKCVWNVCFLAMATMEGNAGLWEKIDRTVKESTVVPKDLKINK